jgi:prepilin-type N-terminal cleavage/methylation domain-containing protein
VKAMDIRKRRGKFKQDGFTLAELLVVVAIIGILVAVSIPIFTSQLEKARLATCLANRRSLLAEVRVKALDSDLDQESAFNALYPSDKADYPCPKGGVFSWKDGQIICSVHDGAGGESVPTINVGGQKVTVTAKIADNHEIGDRVTYKKGDIYLFDGTYYLIKGDYKDVLVTSKYDSYKDWFLKNMVNGQAAVKVNTSSITTLSSKSKDTSAGVLYTYNNIVYITYYNGFVSTKENVVSQLKIFGTLQ